MFESAYSIKTIIIVVILNQLVSAGSMPASEYDRETTTCEEFEKFARFSPYSVVGDEWMSFYYWGPPRPPLFYTFRVPSTEVCEILLFLVITVRSFLSIDVHRWRGTVPNTPFGLCILLFSSPAWRSTNLRSS